MTAPDGVGSGSRCRTHKLTDRLLPFRYQIPREPLDELFHLVERYKTVAQMLREGQLWIR